MADDSGHNQASDPRLPARKAAARRKTQLSLSLTVPLTLLLFLAANAVLIAWQADSLGGRLVHGTLALAWLILCGSLFKKRSWTRTPTAFLFGVILVLWLISASWRSPGLGDVFYMTALAFSVWYLLAPSTEQLFAESSGTSVKRGSLLGLTLLSALILAAVLMLAALNPPSWLRAGLLASIGALLGLSTNTALYRRTIAFLSLAPHHAPRTAMPALRQGLWHYLRGNPERTLEIIGQLPPSQAVLALRVLCRMALHRQLTPLERLLLRASYSPTESEKEALEEECRTRPIAELVTEHNASLAALVHDVSQGSPLFGEEAVAALETMTGRFFLANQQTEWANWLEATRASREADNQLVWLAMRLWGAGARPAAVHAARQCDHPALSLALELAAVLEGPQADPVEEWVDSNFQRLTLLPATADALCILHLDARHTMAAGPVEVARLLRQRLWLVDELRRLWESYDDEIISELPALLAHMTRWRPGLLATRTRFEGWWGGRQDAERDHDADFIEGFDWAGLGEWSAAQKAFARASDLNPASTSAASNSALCLMRLGTHARAEEVFARLARAAPNEFVWWVRLGDCLRANRRSDEALRAYGKAVDLAGLRDALAIRLGLTHAGKGDLGAARDVIAIALGPNPTPASLQEIAETLEQEGATELAWQYRRKAMDAAFESAFSAAEDDDGEVVH